MSRKTLEQRFLKFLSRQSDFESIDELARSKNMTNHQIADYFSSNRKIILEIKSVDSDQQNKFQTYVNQIIQERAYPRIYGTVNGTSVLYSYPDGEALVAKFRILAARHMEGIFRKANAQIEQTKVAFHLPDAVGIVIMLNETEEFYSPYNIRGISKALLGQPDRDKSKRRFAAIDGFCGILESHLARQFGVGVQPVVMLLPSPNINDRCPEVETFLDDVIVRWSANNDSPLLEPINEDTFLHKFRPIRE